MKTHNAILLSIPFFLISIVSFSSCAKDKPSAASSARTKEVVVYAYDSFVGEWGPGDSIIEKFEKATGYKLTFVDCGDAAQVLSRAVAEKNNVQADVLLGIDNNLAENARNQNILASYKPKNADSIIRADFSDALGGDWILTPFDYSHFAIMYDTESNVPAPTSLADLTSPEYKRKLIIMDPRTSTPGIGFAAWTVAIFGDEFESFWKKLNSSILTMSPSWSSGYGLFTNGEAPLALSYVTSAAYHIEYDDTERYVPLIFDEGHILQIEGAGITKDAPNIDGAKAFMDFLITAECQGTLPLTQWMFPINAEVQLPDSYKKLPAQPHKTLSVDSQKFSEAIPVIVASVSGS